MTPSPPTCPLVFGALALPLLIGACSLFRPSVQEQAQAIEPLLATAGFDLSVADTPEKLAHLEELPAMRIVPHRRNGQMYYGFADPYVCKCLYVGNADDYARYQKLKGQQAVADSEQRARMLDADAGTEYDMEDDYWGPFGPFE